MQKIVKVLVLLAFLISGVFAFSLKQPKTSPLPIAAINSSKNINRDLYQQNCARCHGADGKGNTESGKLFDVPDLTGENVQNTSRKQMTRAIANGKGGMPAFKKKLNAGQIASLVNYVRALK